MLCDRTDLVRYIVTANRHISMLYNFRKEVSGAGLMCLLVVGLALPGLAQGTFNQNLVVNPGAESGSGMTGNGQEPVKDVPGWTISGPIAVARTAPGVVTQEGTPKGAGLIYDAGWTLVSAANPAVKGSTVTVIWCGGGQTNPDGVDGRIETQSLPKPKAAWTAKIGGQTATVRFAGAIPFGWAGLLMAQIDVPPSVTAGNALEVLLTAGAATSSAGVTMAVK